PYLAKWKYRFAIPRLENGEHIIAAPIFFRFLKGEFLAGLINLGNEQRVQNMLWPQILQRDFGRVGKSRGSYDELVFRRDIQPKDFAVGHQIKDVGANHGRVADHANERRS